MISEFTLKISCENDAFASDPGYELARILRQISVRVERDQDETTRMVLDSNGNNVGSYTITHNDEEEDGDE